MMREVTGLGAMSGLLILCLGLATVTGELCHKISDVTTCGAEYCFIVSCFVTLRIRFNPNKKAIAHVSCDRAVSAPGGDRRVSHNTLADTHRGTG